MDRGRLRGESQKLGVMGCRHRGVFKQIDLLDFHVSLVPISRYGSLMPTLCDQIPNLSTAEKLVAMEALWTSLHQTFEEAAPPDWHREILNRRMELIQSGEAVYEDWNQVKKELRERTA